MGCDVSRGEKIMKARRFALAATICVLVAGVGVAVTISISKSKVYVGKRTPADRLVSIERIDHDEAGCSTEARIDLVV